MTLPTTQEVDNLLSKGDTYRAYLWTDFEASAPGFKFIKEIQGDDRRWMRAVEVIIQHIESGTYYSYTYDHGLTEYQEDEYFSGSVKIVGKHTKVVEITEYLPITDKTEA